eukprot:scpid79781/ scgid15797/ 
MASPLGHRGSIESAGTSSMYSDDVRPFKLSNLLSETDTYPRTVRIHEGVTYGPCSLLTDCHIAVLAAKEVKVVEFEDMSGRKFLEPLLLDACQFRLRSPKVYDRKYDSVRHVLERNLPDGTLVQARTGFCVDHDENYNVEPGDVFEICNDVLSLGDLEAVSWMKRHGAGQELRAVKSINKGRTLSVVSRCSMTDPIILPLDADCLFCEPFDPECYLLSELVDMENDGKITLPFCVEVAPPENIDEEVPLVQSLIQSQFNVTGFIDLPYLVASDGDEVLLLPKPLCEKIPVVDVQTNAGKKAAGLFNKRCSRDGTVTSVWYPERGSFSAMLHLNTAI